MKTESFDQQGSGTVPCALLSLALAFWWTVHPQYISVHEDTDVLYNCVPVPRGWTVGDRKSEEE